MVTEAAGRAALDRALELVNLGWLMERTQGRPDITIVLIDGPIAAGVAGLPMERIRALPGAPDPACTAVDNIACEHGTFVAAMLAAQRGSAAPAICPGCTFLAHPIFPEQTSASNRLPSTSSRDLAAALVACVDAGARVINLSLGVVQTSARGERELELALDDAARRGVLIVAAAGNQGTIGGSVLCRHAWVIPVAACDLAGAPLGQSNFGASIGRRGLIAPGAEVTSLARNGQPVVGAGTSVAAPFVTGALALLWSEHPAAPAAAIKQAVLRPHVGRRAGIVPPLLDARTAFDHLQHTF